MFLCCGDALFDCFSDSGSLGEFKITAKAAGSPMNVAIGLARYGFETGYFAGISSDFLGQSLRQFLQSENVGTDLCPTIDAPMTLGFVTLNDGGVPDYAFYANGAADRSIEVTHLPKTLPGSVKALHFGSYSTAVEPSGPTLLRLADQFGDARISVYDPNIRPTVVPDMKVWQRVITDFTKRSSMVKISREDIGLVYGEANIQSLVADWQSAGVAVCVVTDGEKGARAYLKDEVVDVPAVECSVVDTVGAGDAFQATLLAGIASFDALDPDAIMAINAKDVGAIMHVAAHASAYVCARQGADMPRREDLPVWFPH